jgi:hypothetical protein
MIALKKTTDKKNIALVRQKRINVIPFIWGGEAPLPEDF